MAEENAEQAATKVQEAAANIHATAAPRERISDRSRETPASDRSQETLASGSHPRFGQHTDGGAGAETQAESVARRYFEAINAHDLDAAVALWAPGGREHVRGQVDVTAPEGVRAFVGELLEAMPDLRWELVDTITEGERCAVQWRMTGTFAGPGTFSGLAPTGHPLTLEGVDVFTVRDGLIHVNDAFTDTMTVPRQIGMMPPLHSAAEQRMLGAFNVKTRVTGRALGEP
jgi:steroid delta-isomerase-like uncharacterized protein